MDQVVEWLVDDGMDRDDATVWVSGFYDRVGESRTWCSLVLNLNPNGVVNNKSLRKKLVEGKIDVDGVVSTPVDEWFTDKWEEAREANKDSISKVVDRRVMYAIDEFHTCPTCGPGTCRTQAIQRRGGDEGNTDIVTCTKCGLEWMVNN